MADATAIERFLAQKHLALVGASRRGNRFGNTVLKVMLKKGYDILPVHPHTAEVDGVPTLPSLKHLPDKISGLILVVPPEETEKLVNQAASAGIKHIWMQQGAESQQAIELCKTHGINLVHGECILMYAQPTGLHKFHHWLWGIAGKLPKETA